MFTAKDMSQVLLVSDMDGTLITAPDPVHPRNLDAIERFVAAGGRFAVATGRAIEPARRFLSNIRQSAPSILVNGGLVYDFGNEEKIWERTLPSHTWEIVDEIKKVFPHIGIEIVVGHDIYNVGHNEFTYRRVATERMQYKYASLPFIPAGWHKVLFATPENIQPDLIDYVRQKHYDGVYFIPTSTVFLELIPEGATKGNALKALGEKLGICRENICAIGDYYNDVSMLDYAGCSASPSAAPDDVKSHTDLTVCDAHEGAVAEFIDYIFSQVVKG